MIGLRALIVGTLVCGLSACAGMPKTPEDAFDEYMDAYADGDAQRLWELSTPSVQRDAERFRSELRDVLLDPDPVRRLSVEGVYGERAMAIVHMNAEQFWAWWIDALRMRLGAAQVRKIVETWRRVRVRPVGIDRAMVVYREVVGRLNQLPVQRIDDIWYVDQSPFPEETGLKPNPDAPIGEDEEPWDPAEDEPESDPEPPQ